MDVLRKILSLLDTESRAAARLTCKKLKDEICYQHVHMQVPDWYPAEAPISRRLMTLVPSFESSLAKLTSSSDLFKRQAPPLLGQGHVGYGQEETLRFFVLSEYLSNVACELTHLAIHSRWLSEYTLFNYSKFIKPGQVHYSLSHMPLLASIHVDGCLDLDAIKVLEKLGKIVCVQMAELPSVEVVEALCSTLSLSRLDLGFDFPQLWSMGGDPTSLRGADDYQRMIVALSCQRLAGLQDLSMPCPSPAVQHLSALTRLTALSIRMWGSMAVLEDLTILTRLEKLLIDGCDCLPQRQRFRSLLPLTALSRLTMLDLFFPWRGITDKESELAVLSELTTLQIFWYCAIQDIDDTDADPLPEDGDPIPVQLRVLSSATALTQLHLWFATSFWKGMSVSQSEAIHASVCGLHCLKDLKVWIYSDGATPSQLDSYFSPLLVFDGAATLHVLRYELRGAKDTGDARGLARGCLTAMTQLRTLVIGKDHMETRILPSRNVVPNCVALLKGLRSIQLTSLNLVVETATWDLLQEITRFGNLKQLRMSTHDIDGGCLDRFSNLTRLTLLDLEVSGSWRQREIPAEHIWVLRREAASLKRAVFECAEHFKVNAHVKLLLFGRLIE